MTPDEQILIAASNGQVEFIQKALDAGADVNTCDTQGTPVLTNAIKRRHFHVVKPLLARHAAADCRDHDRNTPLHYAALLGSSETIDALLDAGADKNARNSSGWTPLLTAARFDQTDAVRRLLERGADRTIADNEGKLPGDDSTVPAVRKLLGFAPLTPPRFGCFYARFFSEKEATDNSRGR